MEHGFWSERWRAGQIGFHQDKVNPNLASWGPRAFPLADAHVLVPLCGKSLDLLWLEEHGHRVTGVEFVHEAVRAFHDENGRRPQISEKAGFRIWDSGRVRILEGDLLKLAAPLLGAVDGVWDRAAYQALPRPERGAYAELVLSVLRAKGRLLLDLFDYEQSEMDGPPFAVGPEEVTDTFGARGIELLQDEDAFVSEPGLRERGLSNARERVYLVGGAPRM